MFALTSVVLLLSGASPDDVYALDDATFLRHARADAVELARHADGLRSLQGAFKTLRALRQRARANTLSPDEKAHLLSTWAAVYDYVLSAELVRQRYWDYWKVPVTNPDRHARGFLLTHAALTLELAHGLAFADIATGEKQLETLLDEASPEHGLAAGAFTRFKEKVVHVATTTQLLTGDAYTRQVRALLKHARAHREPEVVSLLTQMRRHSAEARERLKKRGIALFGKASLDVLADGAARAMFPVQHRVAEWMGDTRVRRLGQPLISRAQAEALLPRMEPGDIIVARQNWYLSNVGLPGFWPHAELFLGRPEQLAAYFDGDPEVSAWTRVQPEREASFSALLARRFPKKWAAYQGEDALGDPVVVLESISEGVSFTGVQHALMTDYLGVMRPRRSKLEKAQALLRAFAYQGRPYDFNFDFFSDATLVCTELVYKSYAPSTAMQGLQLPLVKVAGRMTLPANAIVRLFDQELSGPAPQLDFVAFLDGREKEGRAVEGDLESFRKTHARVKWDIAQK